ncbi:MAG TPA: CaiB/BaiF CoA-transferase family protein [Afifellaceae bacterium]|nr:CaiB/BaiF CoA-transferase family protein [Afifellaceae bacterium]
MTQPLSGLTVVDFSTLLPGPLATLMLAEAGAKVIKIEKPGGEDMRRFPPFFAGGSAPFALLNRGKSSVFIDLKSDAGRERALSLVAEADILVEQFRPGVMARLGLDYETVSAVNPRLIYCSISGYGQTGPRALEAGHDINYTGRTGLLELSWGNRKNPVLPPAQIADIGGGTFPAVINVLLALLQRERTGEGAFLDVAMSDALFTFSLFAQAAGTASGDFPGNGEGFLAGGSPRYGLYPARCGTPICIGALEDHFWARLCEALNIAEDARDDSQDSDKSRKAIAAAIAARTAAEWQPILAAADCCASVMTPLAEAMQDPHFRGRGLFDHAVGDEDGYLPAAVVPIDRQFRAAPAIRPAPAAAEGRADKDG